MDNAVHFLVYFQYVCVRMFGFSFFSQHLLCIESFTYFLKNKNIILHNSSSIQSYPYFSHENSEAQTG